jgi:hypothetical protein
MHRRRGSAMRELARKLFLLAAAGMIATAGDPTTIETRKARARALLERMDFRAALAEAQEVNRIAADDVVGYELIAAAQLALGDYADAEKQLQWMLDLRIGKASPWGWLLLARFREATGDMEGALEAVNQAYASLPSDLASEQRVLMAYAGRLYYFQGKLEMASQAIQWVLASSQTDPQALEVLARIQLARGNRADSIGTLRHLLQHNAHPRYLYLLAEATGAAADYTAFEQAARQITASPDNANRELALYYAGRAKKPAEGLRIARDEAIRRHDVLTLDSLAVALFANRQADQARATMQRVLAVGTRDPEILKHAVRIGVKP